MSFKERATAFYVAHIVPGWYRSLAVIAGWLTSIILFSPDLLQFAADHWDIVGNIALPKFDSQTKALVLGIFTTMVLPPLRAWQQKRMQEESLKHAVLTGAVTSEHGTTEVQINIGGKS